MQVSDLVDNNPIILTTLRVNIINTQNKSHCHSGLKKKPRKTNIHYLQVTQFKYKNPDKLKENTEIYTMLTLIKKKTKVTVFI